MIFKTSKIYIAGPRGIVEFAFWKAFESMESRYEFGYAFNETEVYMLPKNLLIKNC